MAFDNIDEKAIEPIPISQVGKRYRLYNIDAISHIRKHHHICGVFLGSIPQIPQQNVFLGIPLELMPEEARLLVDRGAAYIVDDVQWHANELKHLGSTARLAFESDVESHGRTAAEAAVTEAKARQEAAMQKLSRSKRQELKGKVEGTCDTEQGTTGLFLKDDVGDQVKGTDAEKTRSTSVPIVPEPWRYTPTNSYPPLPTPSQPSVSLLPEVPKSYSLFKQLHSQGYFLSPGLRFGCQYLAYPGDPLRFHSHFLAVNFGWDEEIDLLDLVAGGRLGTGVKKGFLVGGSSTAKTRTKVKTDDLARIFCIEWGGM
ncbi:MAG: tRNA-splicing endonuclease subunit [Vezdaea aestivalis]|nr:MAG: tRNA-splicing endonuclease subunit [Vezdaea aestivalis]